MPATITADAVDKAAARACFALQVRISGSHPLLDANPGFNYKPMRLLEIVRQYLRETEDGGREFDKEDLAWFALGKPHMMRVQCRNAANVTAGTFPNFVFLNAITKSIASGFEQSAASLNYERIVSTQIVPDFKQFSVGALGMSNLVKTAEDAAFPELDKSDGVYSSTVKSWGGTISLTMQALVNDDLRLFEKAVRGAGIAARRTIAKRVFQKLLMGTSSDVTTSTWTSNTTSGCSPVWTTADGVVSARQKVNRGLVDLMNKTGLDGNPLGTLARFFLAGPTAGAYLAGLLGPAPGQQVGNGFAATPELIVSTWLESSSLAGYSTTTFYAVADPNEVSGLVLSKVAGFENIQVQPFDAGAVAAQKWRVWLPFEADLAYLTVGSTATIAAAQQCTT